MSRISLNVKLHTQRMGVAILATLSVLIAFPALAYEVDDFQGRDTLKRDALIPMNTELNWILDRAAQESNKESPKYCNKARLRMEILRWLGPDPVGQIEWVAKFSKEFDHLNTPYGQSIYKNVNIIDSPILYLSGIFPSIKLDGHVIGVDKFGHFFQQGLAYYDFVKDGKDLDWVLENEHHEDGIWGLKTSGVKSYSDMAANYSGYRFWRDLTTGDHHYFRCDKEKGWVKERQFTWSDYVSDAWDEGINCNEARHGVAVKTAARMKELGIHCPVEPARCLNVVAQEKAEHFASPVCKEIAEYVKPVKHPPSIIKRAFTSSHSDRDVASKTKPPHS